jgi:hypothetical protein
MPGWVFPALKAILPHVGTIVEAARPVFARRSAGDKPPVEEQIAELQGAITQNADHIKALAEQLQKTVAVLEEEAEATRDKLKRAYALGVFAAALSVIATAVAVIALIR